MAGPVVGFGVWGQSPPAGRPGQPGWFGRVLGRVGGGVWGGEAPPAGRQGQPGRSERELGRVAGGVWDFYGSLWIFMDSH